MSGTQTSHPVLILGAGGHARVIAEIVSRQGRRLLGFLDDRVTGYVDGYHCLGPIDQLSRIVASLPDLRIALAIGIGDNRIRRRIVERIRMTMVAKQLVFATVIDPSAVISSHANIGAGTVIMPNAVVNNGARIGEHAIINTAAAVDHDCTIGDFVHLSPGVRLAGNVQVDHGAHIGTGAVAIPGVRIGCWSVIGAGSVAVREIPERVVAYGAPARVQRTLV